MDQQLNSPESKCLVLLVEDSYRFQKLLLRKYLNRGDVDILESGERFLRLLSDKQFHFILMDYQLPGQYSGEELIRIARTSGYDGAIIGISSSDMLNRKLLKAGADVALGKREHFLLPATIRQALSIAKARGCETKCEFGRRG